MALGQGWHADKDPDGSGHKAAGKKGGAATIKKYGPNHMSNLGQQGGAALVEKRGKAYMAQIGRKGGSSTNTTQGNKTVTNNLP